MLLCLDLTRCWEDLLLQQNGEVSVQAYLSEACYLVQNRPFDFWTLVQSEDIKKRGKCLKLHFLSRI